MRAEFELSCLHESARRYAEAGSTKGGDPNAYGVALPMVGFDCENAALWRFLRSG